MEMLAPTRMGAIKRLAGLDRAHLEPAIGSAEQNIAYCSKDGPDGVERFGEPARSNAGASATKRTFDDAYDSAQLGDFDAIPKRIRLLHGDKLRQIRQEAIWAAARPSPPELELRQWQNDLYNRFLSNEGPSDRTIDVIVDATGNAGKTTFAMWMLAKHPDDVQILGPGKHADLAYLIEPKRVYIFDCPRETHERIPWSLIEHIKNGYVMSTKYTPIIKHFKIPHVWVFTNSQPDETVLSADRWNIVTV